MPPPPPPDGLAPPGLYIFDIEVIGAAPLYDEDYLRSRWLRTGEHDIEPLAPKLYDVRYILRSNRDASEAWVEVYDPSLTRIAGPTNGPTHAIPESAIPGDADWNRLRVSVDVKYASDQPYRFVFWARDSFPDYDKAHRKKLTLTNQAPRWRGWFMGFGFKFSRGNFISGLPPLLRELDTTGMPEQIAKIVQHIVVRDPKTRKLKQELGYSHEFLFKGQIKSEKLLYTKEIGAQGFTERINRVTQANPYLTGIVYYAGHGGHGRLIGIPDSDPNPKETFGIGGDVDVYALQNLSRVRVFYLDACETCTDAAGNGLIRTIAQRGAWAVIGFHVSLVGIDLPPGKNADIAFFRTLAGWKGWFRRGQEAKTVSDALEEAFKKLPKVKGREA